MKIDINDILFNFSTINFVVFNQDRIKKAEQKGTLITLIFELDFKI